jgi:hypothetical protein
MKTMKTIVYHHHHNVITYKCHPILLLHTFTHDYELIGNLDNLYFGIEPQASIDNNVQTFINLLSL